jgi:hypothetical protein
VNVMSLRRALGLQVAAVAVFCLIPNTARAEAPAEKIRYDFFEDEFGRFRLDRVSGDVQKLVRSKNGIMWETVPVIVSDKSPTANRKPRPERERIDNEKSMAYMDGTGEPEKKRKAPIPIWDKDGNDLTYVISDDMRAAAVPEIASYEKEMAVLLAVRSDDMISGVMTLRNRGDRRIEVLEVTMFVPINGKEKPDQHHFLFVDGKDPRPPQPGVGKESMPLLQKVHMPCPAGGVKGNPELKITYIKFAD